MTKYESEQRQRTYSALISLGFTFDECERMRRISLTLRRWFELECGDGNERADWAIERDENGRPFMVTHFHPRNGAPATMTKTPIADRETGAIKRLNAIVRACNERRFTADDASILDPKCDDLAVYLQTDPRGASIYILRPGDVPDGQDPASCYSRGICIC